MTSGNNMLEGKTIILGITGSIAAFKGADIASKLTRAGANVTVVMTEPACRFITPLTLESITGNQAVTSLWQETGGINHITLAEKADMVLIAPATASIIARLAGGFADDLLSCLVLATKSPVVIAPAMHTAMYENKLTGQNIQKLKECGFMIVEPGEGRLASGAYGKGRLADVEVIIGAVKLKLGVNGDLAGKKIVVTAGGTRESLDPVRYIGNRSSGKTGYEIAQAARNRGACVKLVTTAGLPGETVGMEVFEIEAAQDMLVTVRELVKDADCLIMAAAVADFKPEKPLSSKMKKSDRAVNIKLIPVPDILSEVKGKFLRVGFAAETENLEYNARLKMKNKDLDLVVANDVSGKGAGFGSDYNKVTLIYRDQTTKDYPLMAKSHVADILLDEIAGLF